MTVIGRMMGRGKAVATPPPSDAPALTRRLAFDEATLPWLDRGASAVDRYVESLEGELPSAYDLRSCLLHFSQFGYLILRAAVEPELIDRYLADVERLVSSREASTVVELDGVGLRHVRDCSAEELASPHMRIMDFHNQSMTGKRLALHPTLVSFVGHVLREPVVAMHTLTFMRPTEQRLHQDSAFVVPAEIPSHMMAAWVALEDVHPEAGPLGYYPGSHTIRKFDWGDANAWEGGLFLSEQSTKTPEDFAAYLEQECERAGLKLETFLARKGDVLFWHGSLVHGGTAAISERTRKSFVTHYSSLSAHPRDRRFPGTDPVAFEYGGGFTYIDARRADEENSFSA